MSLAGIVGPLLFTSVFAALLQAQPGAPFLLSAALLVAATALAWRVT
jgi:hypothetical protein